MKKLCLTILVSMTMMGCSSVKTEVGSFELHGQTEHGDFTIIKTNGVTHIIINPVNFLTDTNQ